MGFYIQTPNKFSKADQLIELYDAVEIDEPSDFDSIPSGKALICVVRNFAFEAAGFCHSPREFARFKSDPSGRPRWWLLMDRALVIELTNYKD